MDRKELMARAAELFYQREEVNEQLRRIQIALVEITNQIKALNLKPVDKPIDKGENNDAGNERVA